MAAGVFRRRTCRPAIAGNSQVRRPPLRGPLAPPRKPSRALLAELPPVCCRAATAVVSPAAAVFCPMELRGWRFAARKRQVRVDIALGAWSGFSDHADF